MQRNIPIRKESWNISLFLRLLIITKYIGIKGVLTFNGSKLKFQMKSLYDCFTYIIKHDVRRWLSPISNINWALLRQRKIVVRLSLLNRLLGVLASLCAGLLMWFLCVRAYVFGCLTSRACALVPHVCLICFAFHYWNSKYSYNEKFLCIFTLNAFFYLYFCASLEGYILKFYLSLLDILFGSNVPITWYNSKYHELLQKKTGCKW